LTALKVPNSIISPYADAVLDVVACCLCGRELPMCSLGDRKNQFFLRPNAWKPGEETCDLVDDMWRYRGRERRHFGVETYLAFSGHYRYLAAAGVDASKTPLQEALQKRAVRGVRYLRALVDVSVKRTQRSPSGLPCSTPDKSCSPKTSSRSSHWLTCTYQVHTFRCWDRQMNLSSWRHSRSSRKRSVSWYRQGSIARLVWIAPLVASS